ncbi:MAG: ribosome biogenesis GTPase YlqF [Spirochaetales bacterium]|nr:ribosome biogenesis GTPase YlqF [Spirochaetales bacterium]
MDVQWFPGHMLKTQRLIQESRDKVDVFLEVVDARAPLATANPLLLSLIGDKPRIVLLNKTDLCDSHVLVRWKAWFDTQPQTTSLAISCKERKNLPALRKVTDAVCRSRKWYGLRRVRAMIVGVPNVGKSTLLNALAGGYKASTAPKPGHTRGLQRVNVDDHLDLLDTPGILWHKFEDPAVGVRLALLGSIKDEILSALDLVRELCRFLAESYPKSVERIFGPEAVWAYPALFESNPAWETALWAQLEVWGKKRGMLKHGGHVDWDRLSQSVLSDFRTGKMGHFSLEVPPAG